MFTSSRSVSARAAALWLGVTGAFGLLSGGALPAAAAAPPSTFAELLVVGCAVTALLAATWLWIVTTIVVVDVLRSGPEVRRTAGPVRALLLAACGVAVLTGTAQPAHADPRPVEPSQVVARQDSPLDGLPLPDRATGSDREIRSAEPRTAQPRDAQPAPTGSVRVRPGDSLWAIAEAELGPGATPAQIAAYWPEIHLANRAVVGDDPHLIQPDQRLELPPERNRPDQGGTS